MAEPGEPEYGTNQLSSRLLTDDRVEQPKFEPGEFFRGRTKERIVVRCYAGGSCKHFHTASDMSPCRQDPSGEKRICCQCGGSAYTADSNPGGSRSAGSYDDSSNSRSSSQERKLALINTMDSPHFAALVDKLNANNYDVDDLLPLDKDTFQADGRYAEGLAKTTDLDLKRIIDNVVWNPLGVEASEQNPGQASRHSAQQPK